MVQLGKIKIEKPAALAPMAGFTSSAFRQICSEFGAAFTVSEMISAKALCFQDKKTNALIKFCDIERPFGFQLFGSECDTLAEAAKILEGYNPDFIDINMGCPVPKIAGNGCGSHLLKTPKLAGDLVYAVKKAVNIPVTAKIRIGWDENSLSGIDFAKRLCDNGVDLLSVHGRTREQMYRPPVNIDYIGEIKKAVSVPVVANGDVDSLDSMRKMLSRTGCDLVMIGRAALGNPFIFKELCGEKEIISFKEKMDTVIRLAELESKNKGEHLGILELRRHLPFFFKGLRGAAEFRRRATAVNSIDDVILLTRDAEMCFEEENK